MGEPVLFLRLEAPLQSWGLRARWDIRDSGREPSKSGVVGLVAAALGYARDDPRIAEELDVGLRMGVRVEREPMLLDDYHTVTNFLPIARGGYKHSGVRTASSLAGLSADPDVEPSTIQSRRRYLADGSFLVALVRTSTAPPDLLERCVAALLQPHWPLFLGRRACVPTRPVLDCLTDTYDSIEQALEVHPWSCLATNAESGTGERGPAQQLRVVVESEDGRPRDDQRLSGPTGFFGRRFVREYFIRAPMVPEEE